MSSRLVLMSLFLPIFFLPIRVADAQTCMLPHHLQIRACIFSQIEFEKQIVKIVFVVLLNLCTSKLYYLSSSHLF